MKKRFAIALAGAVMSGLGLIQPGISSAATTCPPAPIGTTISGNLTVSSGACTLTGYTITGSVTVSGTGSLTLVNSTVNGSVTQTGGTLVAQNSTIRGSVNVSGTANNSQNDICGGSIGGSVTVSGVTGAATGWFRLLGTGANMPTGPCTPPSSSFTPLTIGGSVTFRNNNIYVRLSAAQKVGGSVTVSGNTSTAYDPPTPHAADVSANVLINGSLSCSGNTNGVTGAGTNTTIRGSKIGQCAGF